MVKTCAHCKQDLLIEDFYVDASKSDGRKSYCKPCARTNAREWAQANPEQRAATRKAYYAENREEILAKTTSWQKQQTREWFRARERRYLAKVGPRDRRVYARANPHLFRPSAERRRAVKAAAPMMPGATEYAQMVRLDPCAYCGAQGGTADHIVPLSHGGAHAPDNLTGACHRCNSGKRDRDLLIYMAERVVV